MREKSGTSAIENFDPENQGIKIIILNFAKIKQRLKLQDLGPLSAAPRILIFFSHNLLVYLYNILKVPKLTNFKLQMT